MRNLSVHLSTLVVAAALGSPGHAFAQPPQPPPPPAVEKPGLAIPPPPPAPPPDVPESRPGAPMVPLDVQVVISRYQGDKQISRLPYSLAVTANARNEALLNMGSDVPVPTTTFTPIMKPPGPTPAEPPAPLKSFSYRSVGTSISCRATSKEGGQFEVLISVDDTSVLSSDQASTPNTMVASMPVFRSFKARNTLLLADGQTRQYTAAADRVSGEVVRVEVTLKVVK